MHFHTPRQLQWAAAHQGGPHGRQRRVHLQERRRTNLRNQKMEITEYKLVGAITGKITAVHGVGEQAFILDATGPSSWSSPTSRSDWQI